MNQVDNNPQSIIAGLNERQLESVCHQGAPLLVMAGAGSGKTRVLTRRIAYKLATGQATPGQILAITFTNKAAAEMRERVEQLVGRAARMMQVSTFHSACVRFLRDNYEAAGLKSTFTIYDAQDSRNLLKNICKECNIDTKKFSANVLAAKISDLKNELVTPQEFVQRPVVEPVWKKVAEVYPRYMARLKQAHALDFDDLIMRTVQMLQENPSIGEYYHRKFRHILVDEYQDTNHAQYVLVKLLTGDGSDGIEPAELTVVGDSDQSIYAFRGATIRNIDEFEKDFSGAKTVLLEQNYRSTQTILSAANAVIKNNPGRRAKNLWTDLGQGDQLVLYAGESDKNEAQFVVETIDQLTAGGGISLGTSQLDSQSYHYSDIAIFYRMNSQSRAIEEALMRSGINYRVIGGTKFYERKEVKDAMAYLHCVANPDDTVALHRIINVPKRGLGAKSIGVLDAWADMHGVSFGQAVASVWYHHHDSASDKHSKDPNTHDLQMGQDDEKTACFDAAVVGFDEDELANDVDFLSAKARQEIADFWQILIDVRALNEAGRPPADVLETVLEKSGYVHMLEASKDIQDKSRLENLAELHSVAQDFVGANNDDALMEFLEQVSLVSDTDSLPGVGDTSQVTLMTVHTAKGLEFPIVFVTGMEDGIFPHQRSMSDTTELAEERRLAYVAITRAKEKLYLTRSAMRMQWGDFQEYPPSRFLDDIPSELCEMRQSDTFNQIRASFDSTDTYGNASGYRPRQKSGVSHYRRPSSPRVTKRMTPVASRSSTPAIKPSAHTVYAVGDRVNHQQFGLGKVIEVAGQGPQAVVRVDFGDGTTKRLLVRVAPIEKL
ncbi:MAG: UvrD-helicase domain-containing protein [Actinomycetaceae bacterium]|nr:UvrD-helicase domain-containing protein [Actinomycetaceae bacterium]